MNLRVDLTKATSQYEPTCAGTGTMSKGGDTAVAFTLADAGGVEITFNQSPATSHTIFSLFRKPAPGFACDYDELGCTFEDDRSGSVAFSDLPAGDYILIFKATEPGQEGILALSISAFSDRQTEMCNNDCANPACFGIGNCLAPGCMPDINLGSFSWGTMMTTVVDTTKGSTRYKTTCSKGGGGALVIRLTLTQPMALGVDCTQSGSNVIELTQQLAALDACDANGAECADPVVLPFGCGYDIPGLQQGEYNIIVQAYQPGDEGKVTLMLTGIQEIVREICVNPDGSANCADRRCVTQPACAKLACRADKSFGELVLGGPAVSAVVQTTNAGNDGMQIACVSAPSGGEADVDFQLPNKADLTLDWAQVGNHDFALYSDDGTLLPCESGMSYGCIASKGQPTGVTVMPALPAGNYHLVIVADAPGGEGGVAIQISATASQ
jgi:hypothetical protein